MMMPISVKFDDVRSGTKVNARHCWLRPVRKSMGLDHKAASYTKIDQICFTWKLSLFQALVQWGRSKKLAGDERGLVEKKERSLSPLVTSFSIAPTDREPGTS